VPRTGSNTDAHMTTSADATPLASLMNPLP
jgi:hypothetical protein